MKKYQTDHRIVYTDDPMIKHSNYTAALTTVFESPMLSRTMYLTFQKITPVHARMHGRDLLCEP